jgi:hypothetical protein
MFVIGLTLLSCSSPYLAVEKMASCSKGDPITKYSYDGDVGDFKVDYQESFKLEGIPNSGKIEILVYETFILETNKALMFLPMPFKWRVSTYSILAFENDKLIFWGFPEEYFKCDNEKIRTIGEKAVSLIKQNIL